MQIPFSTLHLAVRPPLHAGGVKLPVVTDSDILGISETFRQHMDYFSHSKNAHGMIDRLTDTNPSTLACMHGRAWKGDGASLLRALADKLCQ